MKSIINRTFGLLPVAILFGFGMSIFYLLVIMFYVTGRLPDISSILNSLSSLKQLVEILGG